MAELLQILQAALGDAYTIERELPAGGMSRLVIAADASAFGRLVVIKVLPPELVSPQSTARFKREVDVTAHLQHPHILPVLGAGIRDGLLYYIMPFVEGESLRARIERGERYSASAALRVLREIADALAYAHGKGVVHRDIKPENILLSDQHALVADFGIARGAMSPTLDGTMATGTGVSLGTLGYMAPEQLFPTGAVDARADIYSLGVVAYELLAGAPPFAATSAPALAAAHLNQIPRPLHEIAPTVPRAVSDAVAKALAKEPDDRQASAAELRDVFESALSMLQTGVTLQQIAPPPPRRRLVYAAVAAGTLAVAAAVAVFATRTGHAERLDENRILVVPFNLPDGVQFTSWDGAELWSLTMLNVATRHLDGIGPLTTVDAATVTRDWKGRADAANVRARATDYQAGLAVYGDVTRGGGDTLVAHAQLLDVRTGRTLDAVTVAAEEARPDLLATALALAIVDSLRDDRAITATPNAGLGSRSPPALKEFARGEALYRNTRWDSALVHYERAVAIDSSFALALRRAGQCLAWLRNIGDPQSRAYLRAAGAHNRQLSLRDSLLITADSLSSTLPDDPSDPAWLPRVRRLLDVWNTAVRLYPSDAEVWYARGDAAHHYGYGPGVGVVDREVLGDFARAIALNRSFAPAYEHAIELAFALDLPDSARAYAEGYLALNPQREEASAIRLAKRIADLAVVGSAELDFVLDTAAADQLGSAWLMLRRWSDAPETAVRVARAMDRRGLAVPPFGDPRLRLSLALAYRGHLEEAGRLLLDVGDFRSSLVVEYALLDAFPATQADALFRTWLEEYERTGAGVFPWWTLPWWSYRHQTGPIDTIAQLAQRASGGNDATALRMTYVARAARGYHDLARGDSTRALATLRTLPDSLCSGCYLDRLETARLLARHREGELAARLLDERPNRLLTPTEITLALERGRLAAAMDRTQRAIDAYTMVANAWVRADTSRRVVADEARRNAAALRGDVERGEPQRP